MWDLLDLPDDGTRYVLGAAMVALGTLAVGGVRGWRGRAGLAPLWLVVAALPLLVALGLAWRDTRAIHRDQGGFLFDVDVSSLAPIGARLLSLVHARCWLGLGLSGALWTVLALLLVALRSRATHEAREASAHGGTSPWVTVTLAGAALAASFHDYVHAVTFYELPQHAREDYVTLLTAAADTWQTATNIRVTAMALALVAAVVHLRFRQNSAVRAREAAAVLALLGVALHGDLALIAWARARVVDVLAQPWSRDADFQPIVETELGEDRNTSYPDGAVTVVLGVDGARTFPGGNALPMEHGALVEALGLVRARLAEERALRTAAYEAELALFGESPPEQAADDAAREESPSAMGIRGVLYAPEPWPGCEPADAPDPLSVAVDRRGSSQALRELLRAAVDAGFATIELVGPVVSPSALAQLRDDAVVRALVSAPAYAARIAGVTRCEAAGVSFLRGTVGVALEALEHAEGFTLSLSDEATVAAYRALERPVPTVVLALGADATPLSLMQALSAVETQLTPLALRLVPAPDQLPAIPMRSPLPPVPTPVDPAVDAPRVHALVRYAPGVEERDVNRWLRGDLHDALVACARAGRVLAPDAAGNVNVRLVLGADGRAAIVFARPDETAAPGMGPVASCAADALRATPFVGAPPEHATAMRLTLTFLSPAPE
ncbi:MAG: hypothetical protein R3B40_19875 [Polyangiales bacterium]